MSDFPRGGPRGGFRGGRGGPGGPPRGGGGPPGYGGGGRGGYGGGYGGQSAYDSYANQGPGGQGGYGGGGYGGGYGGMDRGGYAPQGPGGYGGGHGGATGGPGGFHGGPPGGPGYGYGNAPDMVPPSPLDEEIQVVMGEMQNELAGLDQAGEWAEQFKNARRLLIAEKDRLENSIDPEWLEVDIVKPIKVTKKVLIPIYRYPKFNFVGKILGPKGATLQNLCKTYKCHIYVLGRGSTKDIQKEQELLMSGDPQYAHYGGPLHVKVETVAPSQIAYKRVAGVIEELSRILQPVREDTTPEHLKSKEENGSGDSAGDDGEKKSENQGGGGGGPMRGRGRGGRGGGGFNRGGNFGGRGGGRPQPY